ncbi:MAG: hypothetical protein KAI47_03785, partial [Deltaproteobacteria bacterium]|nr:hypothetical protein [Deltaproteobacteria bacterium]
MAMSKKVDAKQVGIFRIVVMVGLGMVALGACGETSDPAGGRGELRVPAGKADNTMSCKGSCGNQAL